MKFGKIIFGIFVGILFLLLSSTFMMAAEPVNVITETLDRGLEISSIIDFEEMSKIALSQHWDKRSPEEKREFVKLFTEFLLNNYIDKIYNYSEGEIVCLGEKQKNNYSKVKIKFIAKKGKKTTVKFCLLYKDGKWKIYDMVAKGMSLINHYRRQFNTILVKSPYEKLYQKLDEKNAKLNHKQIGKLSLNAIPFIRAQSNGDNTLLHSIV
ncbi:MAG: MlaC/ttg2D family ABC transporter substrate-binding protein [Planctomycetota bacterium]|jgi:phospholipid transport system substrate-binding protein